MFDRRLHRPSNESLWLLRHQPNFALQSSLQAMVHRTLPTEPVVSQLMRAPGTTFVITIRDFKDINRAHSLSGSAGLHAFRICAVIHHVLTIIPRRATWTLAFCRQMSP